MLVRNELCNTFLDFRDTGGVVAAKPIVPIDNSGGRKAEPPANASIKPSEAAIDDLENSGAGDFSPENTGGEGIDDAGESEGAPQATDVYADDVEFLKELDPDTEYTSVREALTDLIGKNKNFQSEFEPLKRLSDQLESIGKALNVPPDELLGYLQDLNPQNMATAGPQWENTDKFLASQNIAEDYKPFYKNLAGSLAQDIRTQMQSEIARAFHSLNGQMNDMQFQGQMSKFMSNPKNAERAKGFSEKQIKQVIQQTNMTGKPNAIDFAVRFLLAGQEPPAQKKAVNVEAKNIAQNLLKKIRETGGEPAGRPIKTGGQTRRQQSEAAIDALEREIGAGDMLSILSPG